MYFLCLIFLPTWKPVTTVWIKPVSSKRSREMSPFLVNNYTCIWFSKPQEVTIGVNWAEVSVQWTHYYQNILGSQTWIPGRRGEEETAISVQIECAAVKILPMKHLSFALIMVPTFLNALSSQINKQISTIT